jgi:methanogenic corrinoid protein MtbC1
MKEGQRHKTGMREGQTMSSDLHWAYSNLYDPAIQRLKTFTKPLAPVVAKPSETHLQEFASVIENVIVPKLLMSHVRSAEDFESRAETEKPVAQKQKISVHSVAVADFVALTMKDDPDCAVDYVRHLLDNGVEFQDILLELMAPAARTLGEMWTNDTASFVEVTLGVARMHRILREFDGVPAHFWGNSGAGCHTLLMPTPGEQHTFGLRLVQEFLLREGWAVTNSPIESLSDLAHLVSQRHFDVVGLSLSGEILIESLLSAIRVIRSDSVNKAVKIIVGGQLFVERPELAKTCGSDAFGIDAPATVRIFNGWAKQLSAVM